MLDNLLQFCSSETENNFIFCSHSKIQSDFPIQLVITDSKEDEGVEQVLKVNYCPFCGYTRKSNKDEKDKGKK